MKLVKLPPDAQQAVEASVEEEEEGEEVAQELEVAVKHFESTKVSINLSSSLLQHWDTCRDFAARVRKQ